MPGVPWSRVHWHWSCIPGVPECPLKSQEEPVWSAGARCARQCHSSACSDHMGTAGQGKAGARGALTLHARTGGAQAPHTRPTMASPQCSDYRQVALPRPKRDPDLFESSTKSRVAGVVALKVLDLAVHLYTMAVSSFSLHLAVIHLHQVTQTIPYTLTITNRLSLIWYICSNRLGAKNKKKLVVLCQCHIARVSHVFFLAYEG